MSGSVVRDEPAAPRRTAKPTASAGYQRGGTGPAA